MTPFSRINVLHDRLVLVLVRQGLVDRASGERINGPRGSSWRHQAEFLEHARLGQYGGGLGTTAVPAPGLLDGPSSHRAIVVALVEAVHRAGRRDALGEAVERGQPGDLVVAPGLPAQSLGPVGSESLVDDAPFVFVPHE